MAGAPRPPAPSNSASSSPAPTSPSSASPSSASPTPPRLESRPTGGILEPPLGTGALAVLTLLLVLGGGLVLWQTREPLAQSLDGYSVAGRLLGPPRAEEPDYGPETPAEPQAKVVVPEAPAWTLLQVAEAVRVAGPRLEALLAEGRGELAEFEDLDSDDEARAARTLRFWQSWGRSWQNRLEAISKDFPPAESCAVHAAMGPACETLEQVRALVARIPDATTREDAESRLELAAAALDGFLNPPPESEEEEAEGEEGAGDDARTEEEAGAAQA